MRPRGFDHVAHPARGETTLTRERSDRDRLDLFGCFLREGDGARTTVPTNDDRGAHRICGPPHGEVLIGRVEKTHRVERLVARELREPLRGPEPLGEPK